MFNTIESVGNVNTLNDFEYEVLRSIKVKDKCKERNSLNIVITYCVMHIRFWEMSILNSIYTFT